jgi:hypothetical protein
LHVGALSGRRLKGARPRRAAVRPLAPVVVSAIAVLGAAVLVLCLGAPAAHAGAGDSPTTVTVLELFTSQGCSSCPPADRLLGQLARRKDVVALSLPVGYWDYLGWKDTLARPAYSERQRHYSEGRGEQVYTPQLWVNGLVAVVGSNQAQIEKAILASVRVIDASRVPVAIGVGDEEIAIDVGPAPEGASYRSGAVWVAWLTRRMAVDVTSGENQGRRLSYYNVVRDLKQVGSWDGAAGVFKLPKAAAVKQGFDLCVALVQSGDGGPILGAAQAEVKSEEAVERD